MKYYGYGLYRKCCHGHWIALHPRGNEKIFLTFTIRISFSGFHISLCFTHTHTLRHTPSDTHTLTLRHTHTHPLTLRHTHTLTLCFKGTHTLTPGYSTHKHSHRL